MANNYRVIDEKTWERAMHCMVFRNSVEPAFCVTFEADITSFKRKVNAHVRQRSRTTKQVQTTAPRYSVTPGMIEKFTI